MAHDHEKITIGLKKARSSLEKVFKMVEEDSYCIDVIQQNLAVIGLLRSVNLMLLEGHLHNCVRDAAHAQDEKRLDAMMEELLKVTRLAQSK